MIIKENPSAEREHQRNNEILSVALYTREIYASSEEASLPPTVNTPPTPVTMSSPSTPRDICAVGYSDMYILLGSIPGLSYIATIPDPCRQATIPSIFTLEPIRYLS